MHKPLAAAVARVSGAVKCGSKSRPLMVGLACAGLCAADASHAGTYALGDDGEFHYQVTLNYGLAVRTGTPSNELINGPMDPFQIGSLAQGTFVTHTQLPQTVNSDDGDRNFKQWSLIHNRISGLLETQTTWRNYGLIVSADAFYDQAYRRPNYNSSDDTATLLHPSTANVYGPANQFTDTTRYYDGRRFRMLDTYAYGDWSLTDAMRLDLRVGKQLVAWGESLFFSGVAAAQGPADATKAFVPGAEIKEILLPVNQIAGSLTLGYRWTLLAQYKLQFKPNEIFPEGDYFSPTDAVGPGARFSVGALDPLSLINGLNVLGAKISAPPTVLIPRVADAVPSDYGQWGLGLKYQVASATTLEAYWLRYHDTNPSVVQNVGYVPFGTVQFGNTTYSITSKLINEPAPKEYYVEYFDGVDLASLAFTTGLGPVNVAGELNFRNNASIPVTAIALGETVPVFERGKATQALLSAIYATNPHLYFDDMSVVGEAGYLHVNDVDPAHLVYAPDGTPGVSPAGIVPADNNGQPIDYLTPGGPTTGDKLFYSKNSWAFEGLIIPTKHSIMTGWDLSTPINFGGIVTGTPSIPGAFGAYAGAGDYRLGLGVNMTYLQNLQLGFGYNMFFGSASKNIGNSFVKQNPYVDRDYMTLNVKYSL
jgi:hypothetical protein